MNHLTEEQFDDILQGSLPEPEHISRCELCKRILEEKKAVINRLRSAFVSISPDENLVKGIRKKLISPVKGIEEKEHKHHLWIFSFKAIVWQAAAAVIIIAVVLGIYMVGPQPVMAAPAELVKIHQNNLSDNHGFYSESDPEKLAEYLKDELGFSPSLPELGRGMALRGCCVKHFRGQVAGSYVVDTPEGIISIVIVTDEPNSLEMKSKFEQQGHIFYKDSFAKCNMVTTRLGNYSYCAVGQVSHEYLTELLNQLISNTQE